VYPHFGARGPSGFGWYRGLYTSGFGWGGYRSGHPRPLVVNLGSNGYIGQGGGYAAPAPAPASVETDVLRARHGSYAGGYWGGYWGGYGMRSRPTSGNPGSTPATPTAPPRSTGSGHRGSEPRSSGAVMGTRGSHGGGASRPTAGHGGAGSVSGASRGDNGRRR
jgi:hypothetical protein